MSRPLQDPLFVGRERELSELDALLDRGERLVTLLGPGGAGKTQLALRALRDACPDADPAGCFVDCSEASSLDGLVAVVADALAITPGGAGTDALIERLARSAVERGLTLLVLDNLEQLVNVAVPALQRWLVEAPELRLLVTSRRALGLDVELLIRIGMLPEQDARTLFEAVAARRGAPVAEGDRPLVAQIVARLDRLPLAIRLAAARAAVLSPREILARLESRFPLVRRDRAGDRHASLLQVLEASWELLAADQQRALARLAVLGSDFDAAAAAAVIGASDAETVSILHGLRDSSLLVVGGGSVSRFSLYESVRALAVDKLEARSEGDDARRASARHFARLASEARERGIPLLDERHHLTRAFGELLASDAAAAAQLLVDAAPAFERDPVEVALRRVESAIAALGDRASTLVGQLEVRRARLLRLGGQLTAAESAARRALSLAGDRPARAAAHHMLGHLLASMGRDREADDNLAAALRLARAAGDRGVELEALTALANLDYMRRRHGDAQGWVSQIFALGADAGPRGLGLAHMVSGLIAIEQGAHEVAETELSAARQQYEANGDEHGKACLRGYVASLELDRGGAAAALAAADEGIATHHLLGVHPWTELTLITRALAQRSLGQPDAALASIRAGELFAAQADPSPATVVLAATRSGLLAELGRTVAATVALDEARGHLTERDNPLLRSWVRAIEGLVAVARAAEASGAGEATEAARALDEARSCLADLADPPASGLCSAAQSYDTRVLTRWLAQAIGAREAATDDPPADRPGRKNPGADDSLLWVAADGSWFAPPGNPRVPVDRAAWRRLICALAGCRAARPGDGLTTDELVAAGWPGEKLLTSAGRNRVWVALSGLRAAGLDAVLVRKRGRYSLDPRVEVRVADQPFAS